MSLGDEHGPGGERGRGGTGRTGGQTRTRLPEGDSSPHSGPRRPARAAAGPSRNLVTVVAVVVLLIAAIAFANRGGDDSGADDDSKRPATSPTAATGERPVDSKTSTGIPSGFSHDEQGAQSAATNYAVALGSDGMFRTAIRHDIVTTLYTPEAATDLTDDLDKAYSPDFLAKMGLDGDGNAPEGSTFVSRTIPVGAKIVKYSTSDAKIAVWYMGLIGMSGEKSTNPVTSTWKTWTFDLKWSQDDWKIDSDEESSGPAPVPGDDPAASSDKISKAVQEYGGYTYAR